MVDRLKKLRLERGGRHQDEANPSDATPSRGRNQKVYRNNHDLSTFYSLSSELILENPDREMDQFINTY